MLVFIEAMHLLPQSFGFQTAHSSSQGASVGTAALLLPVAVRFFSKSLPHLLPRQAFSFSGPAASKSEIELRFLPALFGVERRKGDPQEPHRTFEREHRGEQGLGNLQHLVDVRRRLPDTVLLRVAWLKSEYLILTVTVLPVMSCASQ